MVSTTFTSCSLGWGRVLLLMVLLSIFAVAAQGQVAPADVAAPPPEAQVTTSGLASKVLQPGTGTVHPTIQDRVKVHYTGWTTDGERFDSSHGRGRPSIFPLNRVIAGWGEGVQLMVEGEKRRFWIPEELAYGGQTGRPQGMLVFDIELLEIAAAPRTAAPAPPKAPPAPRDVAAPPDHAERLKSGLAWIVLEEGHGTRRPKVAHDVTVHYTGWTTDGHMFDSSLTRGQPSTFNLTQVIRGWAQGIRLMVEGEKRRFWIPEKLAYQGRPGKPKGMLVFDVELIEIK